MSLPDLKPCPFCGSDAHYDTDTRDESVYCGSCGRYGCRDDLHFNIAIAGCTQCSASFRTEFGDGEKTMEEEQARMGEAWNFRGRSCDACDAPYTPRGPLEPEQYGRNRCCENCASPEEADWTLYLTDEELALATDDRRPLLMTISELRKNRGAHGP